MEFNYSVEPTAPPAHNAQSEATFNPSNDQPPPYTSVPSQHPQTQGKNPSQQQALGQEQSNLLNGLPPNYYSQVSIPSQHQHDVVQPSARVIYQNAPSVGNNAMVGGIVVSVMILFCLCCFPAWICSVSTMVFASKAQSADRSSSQELAKVHAKRANRCLIATIITVIVIPVATGVSVGIYFGVV